MQATIFSQTTKPTHTESRSGGTSKESVITLNLYVGFRKIIEILCYTSLYSETRENCRVIFDARQKHEKLHSAVQRVT